MNNQFELVNRDPLVSIIVPVYNVEQYIDRFFQSVLNQTYLNWELILIDDGATDSSGVKCDEYKKLSDKITVVHQKNKGVSAARNKGIEISSGEYILFADPDDWLSRDMIATMIEAIIKEDAKLAACNMYVVIEKEDKELQFETSPWPHINKNTVIKDKDVYYQIFAQSATLWNKIISRDIVSNFTFDEDIDYGEDMLFLCHCLSMVDKAVIVPIYGYYYNRGRIGNVVSSEINSKSYRLLEASKRAYLFLKNIGYIDLAIARISVSYTQVIGSITDFKKFVDKKQYIVACRNTALIPKLSDRMHYYLSPNIALSTKANYLSFILSPKLWFFLRNR